MAKNYSGSDLSKESKSQLNSWIRSIKKILAEKNCTKLDFSYGFHFFSGFFTAPSGQIYYIGSSDTRFQNMDIYYRTSKSYTDYSGGMNYHLDNISDLKNIDFK